MINVGFLLNFTVEYKGGINYLKNLFYAIKKHHSDKVNITLFVPDNLDEEYINLFSPYAKIVRTKILQRKSMLWFLSRVAEKFVGFDPFVYFLLNNNDIDCISHSNYVYPFNKIKTINWIPDFQYLYYPDLWTKRGIFNIKKQHSRWIKKSDLVVVSSEAAKNDLLSAYPTYDNKVEVLHFVSQSSEKNYALSDDILNKSTFAAGNFFYLPNQFWLHKNHLTVFKAVKILKDKGLDIKLITTGAGVDYRAKGDHFKMLLDYVKANDLENNIEFLGLVSYSDVLSLMKSSLAVINPSYFEGWSSTVEESKSVGNIIILSNIQVHKEQNPQKGIYFNPDDENELAGIMEQVWDNKFVFNAGKLNQNTTKDLEIRTKEFSDNFYKVLTKLFA